LPTDDAHQEVRLEGNSKIRDKEGYILAKWGPEAVRTMVNGPFTYSE